MELIALHHHEFAGEMLPTVNARDLHDFLTVRRDFTNWIKDRIKQYGFQAGIDYILTFAKIGERRNVKRSDYHLTLDMAKELSMVERTAKGREARLYFIACEKRLKMELSRPLETEPAEAPALMADDEEMRAIHKVRLAGHIFGKGAARALWFKVGLPVVPEMLGENTSFRQEDDAVAIFAREGLEHMPGHYTQAETLWPSFLRFCAERELTAPPRASFFTRLGRMGLPKRKMRGRSVYIGLKALH